MAKVPSPHSANPFEAVEKTQKVRPAKSESAAPPKEAKAVTRESAPFRPPPAANTLKKPVSAPPSAPVKSAKDDFAARASPPVAQQPPPASTPLAVPKLPKAVDSFAVLHAALEHGTYFVDDDAEPTREVEPIDPDFAAAIEEVRALLEEVQGVVRVGAGRDEAQAPVILVVTSQGFGEASMKQVPEKVKGFSTLITVPYTLLPLRRER